MSSADRALRNPAPRPWRLESGRLVIGDRPIRLADLRQVSAEGYAERDFDGQLMLSTVYVLLGSLILIAVIVGGARNYFLIGTALLWMIAACGLQDVLTARPIKYYRVRLGLADGSSAEFASADLTEVEGLLAVLRGSCPAIAFDT